MNTLLAIFTTVLNMSITASFVAIGVIIARLMLKKMPEFFSYALWSAVLIRLVFPVSFTSTFSFLSVIKPELSLSDTYKGRAVDGWGCPQLFQQH